MKRIVIPVLFLLCSLAALLRAASPVAILYAESFRQSQTRITERAIEARLDPVNPIYRERIKDARGADRYVFTIFPQGPEGDNKVTSWQARLVDLHHPFYDNILLASQTPSSDAGNNLWRLDPGKFAIVPVAARRVIKVDGFYVSLQVQAYHFTPIDSPYLDSMTVDVKFRNTDPRGDGSS
jgi:hypothetical protein